MYNLSSNGLCLLALPPTVACGQVLCSWEHVTISFLQDISGVSTVPQKCATTLTPNQEPAWPSLVSPGYKNPLWTFHSWEWETFVMWAQLGALVSWGTSDIKQQKYIFMRWQQSQLLPETLREENPCPAPGGSRHSLACGRITPVSTSASSLCVSVCQTSFSLSFGFRTHPKSSLSSSGDP
jgi:hypothetical protein